MATLYDLVGRGKLKRLEPELDEDELPLRYLYCAPEFENWVSNVLAAAKKDRGRDLVPVEQLWLIAREFVMGAPMAYGVHHKKLDPLQQHVWELRTEDVRLFGWFAAQNCFVIVCGEMKKFLVKRKQYEPHIQTVVQFRSLIDLDEPKTITGINSHDVV